MRSFLFAAALAGFFCTKPVMADEFVSVELQPMTHFDAQLVVLGPDGRETTYSPSELERLPTYRLVTTTPWRDVPATFEGVLLADVLKANGLSWVTSILVTAENDYKTAISREVWENVDILVATRVDGKPHSRRARGPIQFVIDADTYASSDLVNESMLVWMAAHIEAGS